MKKIIVLFGLALMLFTGCSNSDGTVKGDTGLNGLNDTPGSENTGTEQTSPEGFAYVHQDTTIPMNVDAAPIVEELGEPADYFEAASCAFQGLDKIFYYNGFEVGTYPNGDTDMISYVNLLDDTVTTDQGIYLGSTLADMKAAYGEDYTNEGTAYIYRKGETKLTFIVENDAVTQITYAAVVEGLNN